MNNLGKFLRTPDKEVVELLSIDNLEKGHIRKKDNTLIDFFQIMPKDFSSCTNEQIEHDIYSYTKFFRLYSDDIKFIGLNFPVDTAQQCEYFGGKLNSTNNEVFKYHLKVRLSQLEFIEKNTFNKEFYLMIFAKNEEKLKDYQGVVYSLMESKFLVEHLSDEKKKQIVFKLCNKSTSIFDRL